MNYHNITYPDMNNGSGLRVVLWLSGCNHRCYKCQNPQTWDVNSGIEFDEEAENELFNALDNDYISGLTLTGGDPLHENNLDGVLKLVDKIHLLLPQKSIWLYTGYTWEDIIHTKMPHLSKQTEQRKEIVSKVDVLVDGSYIDEKRDVSLKWIGSSNQRVIDIKKSLEKGEIILWDTNY